MLLLKQCPCPWRALGSQCPSLSPDLACGEKEWADTSSRAALALNALRTAWLARVGKRQVRSSVQALRTYVFDVYKCPPSPQLTTATGSQMGEEEDGYSYSPSLHGSFRRDEEGCRGEEGRRWEQLQSPWSHLPESGAVWGSSYGHLCSPVLLEAHTAGPRGQGSSVPTAFTQCDIWAEEP